MLTRWASALISSALDRNLLSVKLTRDRQLYYLQAKMPVKISLGISLEGNIQPERKRSRLCSLE
jgi:hypothetical protein